MIKIIRISTVPISLNILLKGQLKFLSKSFKVIAIASEGQDLIETQQREGIDVIAVNMERGISPFKDFISLIKLYIQFKKQKPTIVHSITPKAGLLSMLAGKLAGVPIRMHTFTGLIFPTKHGFLQKILIQMDKLLCWGATNIYPEGNGVKLDLIKYKITNKPLKVLANGNVNGIDLSTYSRANFSIDQINELKANLGITKNNFIFIFVGRLLGDKGINELIEAFTSLHNSSCKLLLVGPLENEMDPLKEETLREIDENLNIISVGFQKDVRPYFTLADVLVFPSYREGFPNVVLQAGAMELPSIVTDINGCNEIIVEGKNGIIIPVKDVEGIKQAMIKMFEDINYFKSLQQNSRKMIADRFEEQFVWNALVREYERLLKMRGLSN